MNRRKRRRTDDRREQEEQASEENVYRNPMAMPDSPMPDAPIPDATMPSAKPTGAMSTNPIPQTSIRSLGSRGYGAESQQHILRATEETEADPHDLPDPVLDVLASGTGQSLDASIQRALEDRMDADFSNVEIHTGSEAAKAADAIDAKAFTCGTANVFNEGEYDPESAEGQHLLAHELAHVKQQTGAAISMMPQADADLEIDPDPQLEREADRAAEEALEGDEPLIVNRMGTDVHIQRSTKADSMTYEGLDNLTEAVADLRETVSQNQQEIQETKSSLGTLEDEIHAGPSKKAMGVAGGAAATGAIALGRAASEPALQEMLAEVGTDPELAAPAMAATVMAAGVGAVGVGAKGLWDRARERFFGDGTDDTVHQNAEDTDESGNSRLGIF